MAAIVPTVVNSGDASVTVTGASTGVGDTLTFAAISAALPASAANYRIKAFLDAARGSVAATLAALASNGCSLSITADAAVAPAIVSADKTLAGIAASNFVLRLSLSYSASN